MTQGIDWPGLANTLLASAAQAIVAGLAGFAAAWVTFRYESRRDTAKLEAELRRDLLKARTEKRDQLLDEIWKKVRVALDRASVSTAMYKEYPDFKRLSEEATVEILEGSRLTDRQKRELISADDRTKYYVDATFWLQLADAREALYGANAFFLDNRIHVPESLAMTLDALFEALNSAYISYEIWHSAPEPQLMKSMRSDLKSAQDLAASAESQLRSLLEKP